MVWIDRYSNTYYKGRLTWHLKVLYITYCNYSSMEVSWVLVHRLQGPWHGCPCLLMLAFGGKTFSQLFWNGIHNMTIGSDWTFLQPYHLKIQVAIHWWPCFFWFILSCFRHFLSFSCFYYQLYISCLCCHVFFSFFRHFPDMTNLTKNDDASGKCKNDRNKWQCFWNMQNN